MDIDAYLARVANSAKELPAGVIGMKADSSGLVAVKDRRRMNAPMRPEDFESLISDRKK